MAGVDVLHQATPRLPPQ